MANHHLRSRQVWHPLLELCLWPWLLTVIWFFCVSCTSGASHVADWWDLCTTNICFNINVTVQFIFLLLMDITNFFLICVLSLFYFWFWFVCLFLYFVHVVYLNLICICLPQRYNSHNASNYKYIPLQCTANNINITIQHTCLKQNGWSNIGLIESSMIRLSHMVTHWCCCEFVVIWFNKYVI